MVKTKTWFLLVLGFFAGITAGFYFDGLNYEQYIKWQKAECKGEISMSYDKGFMDGRADQMEHMKRIMTGHNDD